MRKLIVKYFALSYRLNILGAKFNMLRASSIISPIFILTGVLHYNEIYYTWPLLLVVLFYGFVYFRFYPVKWNELDDYQKYLFGKFNFANLTKNQIVEWKNLTERYDS